jgi:formate dehydrogenase (NADP+) beta subunit
MSTANPNPVAKRRKKIAVYLDRLPPCNNACPAGENIQLWLNYFQKGLLQEAWQTIMVNNPMPATHGRVCYHPCETACNRKNCDSSVSIHCVERFLGDLALKNNWRVAVPQSTGKKVLVVGAGPAGLSAAYHLRCLGHEAVIYEAAPFAGGMMHTGIPPYRLPRDILEGEIRTIEACGVKIECDHPVTDIIQEKENGNFDATFLAIGAQADKRVNIPGNNQCPIWGAIDFLKAVEMKTLPQLGSSLAVYGGGNTAMDVARVAKRLGVKDISIIYRRDRAHMPAFALEVEEALEEGVKLLALHTIKEINNNDFVLEVMEMTAEGKPKSTGKTENFSAEMLVLALGQDPELESLRKDASIKITDNGLIAIDETFMTTHAGVFAGGDMITDDRSVTISVGHGKKAARYIDAYLRQKKYTKPVKHEIANHEFLHVDNAPKVEAATQSILAAEERCTNFKEVVAGINAEAAAKEADRCFSCGNCFECDACFNICPVDAIIKLGPGKRYRIDLDTCIGCGKCCRACPCGAIKMVDDK